MKKILLLLCIALLAGYGFSANAADFTVNVSDFQYSPATLNIKVGDRVTWQWQSGDHPTVSDSSPAAWSPFQMNSSSRSFSHTFSATGSYPYHCEVHGTGMSGVINVTSVTGIGSSTEVAPLMEVYPNPARESFLVKLDLSNLKVYRLTLTSITGQTISVSPATGFEAATGEGVKVDVNHLAPGLYFLRLFSNDKIMDTRRLVLTK